MILLRKKLIESGYNLQSIREAFKPDEQQLESYIEIDSDVEVHKMDISTKKNRKSVDGYVYKSLTSLYVESKYSNIATRVLEEKEEVIYDKYFNLEKYKTLLGYFMQMDDKVNGTDESIKIAIQGIGELETRILKFKKYIVLFIDAFGEGNLQSNGRTLVALRALEIEIRKYFKCVNMGEIDPISSINKKKKVVNYICESIDDIKVIYTRENMIKLIKKFQ